jgi:2-keto-3-deoxy-L-fuconate dehydrogenase
MNRLMGKKVLITAAGQGMGRAAAIAMANEGAKVFATDINTDMLEALSEENSAIETFELDVLDPLAIAKAPEKTGPLTTLFNCAGFVHNGTILDMSDDDWDFSFTLNVRSQFRLIQAYLPGMLSKKDGSIINMASVASSIKGAPNRCLYGSTKAAILGLTKAVAADYVSKGIRCNALCPGTIMTPSLEDRMRETGDYENAKIEFLARQPIGRFASSEEVVGILIHLASDESKFTTGTFQIVDGGWSL